MSEDHGKIQDQGFGFEFRRPGSFSQGTRRNLLIFLVLSILTLSNAFESTSLSVAISVSLCSASSSS